MKATEFTVQLPPEEATFLEGYAKEHATSVAEIFTRYAKRLHQAARREPHPKDLKFTGSVPVNANAREEHRQHLLDKHR